MDAMWVIEITRKCKLSCDHCLRGRAQNKSMEGFTFRTIVDRMEICNVALTGGEPLLNTSVLREVVSSRIDHLYIATSGWVNDIDTVMDILGMIRGKKWMELYIDISTDHYHIKNHDFEDSLSLLGIEIGNKNNLKYKEAIFMGRAFDNQLGFGKAEEFLPMPNDGGDTPTIMINIDGDVFPGCDWSYRAQRKFKKRLCLGNALRDSIKTIEENYKKLIGGVDCYLRYTEEEFSITPNE